MSDTIILANRVYVPTNMVSEQKVEELYETHTFVETTCRRCKVFQEGLRPAQKCFTCTGELPGTWNGYSGHLIQWRKVNIKGRPYYSLPAGNLYEIAREFGLDPSTFRDLRCKTPMDVPLTFTGKLFTGREVVGGKKMANQIGIVKKMWRTRHRSGIICAPMRTGKTVLGAFFACAFKSKTVIIAHETILLKQFEREIRRFTDVTTQERLTGRRLMVLAEKERDLKGYPDILLINYQKLISEIGIDRAIKYIQKRYALLIGDEIHRVGTDHYGGLMDRLDPTWRIGFSATPKRRDGRELVFFRGLGPVVVNAKVDTLKPTVYVHYTECAQKKEYRGRPAFVRTCSWLAEQDKRNFAIVRQAFQDLRANPKHIIVIPCMKVAHAKMLVALINRQARVNFEKRGEKWASDLAIMLWRESDKEKVIADVTAYRHRVLVAIQKFVREGTNIPPLTHYYSIFPQNNQVSTQQGTGRVLTPADGKPDPIVRYWVDPISISISCFKNTHEDSLKPLGYKFAAETQPTLDLLLRLKRDPKTKKYYDPQDPETGDDLMGMW